MAEPMPNPTPVDTNLTHALIDHAAKLYGKAAASDILLYADVFADFSELKAMLASFQGINFVLATRNEQAARTALEAVREVVVVPDIRLTRMGQIKVAVLVGLSTGVFERGDRLVCLSGIAESATLDTIVVMEVGKEFEMFAPAGEDEIRDSVNTEVFNEVLKLAVTLGNEGREGKPVGTMFVIGAAKELAPYTRQMVLNPFRGYSEDERRIFDRNVQETIKEFSLIDGAFVITNDGIVETAGAYLVPPSSAEDLPRGLGARHHVAAGLTSCTSATAITVSESTGTATVFQNGRIFVEIEPPRRIGAKTRKSDAFFADTLAEKGQTVPCDEDPSHQG
ncbi:MAG: diadenylate cyclase [Sedimentisphaerales bacterium]|nr:diadenylate cyclase [Sedimentisphaerales bacterium]